MPTITDLIRAEIDAGRSVRQLAADSGHLVKHQTFQELSNQPPKQFPKEIKTIAGMAAALRCAESTIVLAYARSLGVDVESRVSTFALRLPTAIDQLSPAMTNALISVVRAAISDSSDDMESGPSIDRIGNAGLAELQVNRRVDDAEQA